LLPEFEISDRNFSYLALEGGINLFRIIQCFQTQTLSVALRFACRLLTKTGHHLCLAESKIVVTNFLPNARKHIPKGHDFCNGAA